MSFINCFRVKWLVYLSNWTLLIVTVNVVVEAIVVAVAVCKQCRGRPYSYYFTTIISCAAY